MATLTPSQFTRDLTEFISRIDQYSREKWTLHQSSLGICAKQSVMVKWRGETVNRQVHITYNSTYSVPVLWFNFYRRDGRPLDANEALELSPDKSSELLKTATLNEHPLLGVLFYNLHPCNTGRIMAELTTKDNYIAKWLSVYGSVIGVHLPVELFVSGTPPNSALLPSETPPPESETPTVIVTSSDTSQSSASEEDGSI